MTNKDEKSFDGLDISKISQGDLIGITVGVGLPAQAGKNMENVPQLDIDFDDPEGMLPENFAEIFQTAVKNIISATDQLNGGDIFLDLPLSPQKARQGGYIPLEYQRYIHCSQCQEKSAVEARGCSKCHGVGRVMAHRRVEIKIPKDSTDGAVLQISNEGHAPKGDLFVKVTIREEL